MMTIAEYAIALAICFVVKPAQQFFTWNVWSLPWSTYQPRIGNAVYAKPIKSQELLIVFLMWRRKEFSVDKSILDSIDMGENTGSLLDEFSCKFYFSIFGIN